MINHNCVVRRLIIAKYTCFYALGGWGMIATLKLLKGIYRRFTWGVVLKQLNYPHFNSTNFI